MGSGRPHLKSGISCDGELVAPQRLLGCNSKYLLPLAILTGADGSWSANTAVGHKFLIPSVKDWQEFPSAAHVTPGGYEGILEAWLEIMALSLNDERQQYMKCTEYPSNIPAHGSGIKLRQCIHLPFIKVLGWKFNFDQRKTKELKPCSTGIKSLGNAPGMPVHKYFNLSQQ